MLPLSGKRVITIADDDSLDDMLDMETDTTDAHTTKISDIFNDTAYHDKILGYEYDLGDGWEHSIEIIGRAEEAPGKVVCLTGEGHPGVEDCGGPYGLMGLRRRPGFEVWKWDIDAVNRELRML
jgi:hypothetical protein